MSYFLVINIFEMINMHLDAKYFAIERGDRYFTGKGLDNQQYQRD